ncbi:MAG: HIT family protein [Deltaproteobacteria bacterium HGW-Deltaproteobacteria-18]|jgi:diadenosine tetraphosphate (Ap4A) HIT family hydrolase|nr:MAG: HIT family protein [Deltaproteobacteria bacterium HGW-Deltaproteobacteria-18]PKN46346.1 MAG: HIT family protein [Deltaproteobacteria bacterium HGW-Deltaproteobacteria-20]
MKHFKLHPTLAADCHDLGVWRDLRLLLHRDAHVPWIILVPETSITEWHELPGDLHRQLLAASTLLARMLKTDFACDKVNVAAIGNMVPQFHYHVIGRWRTDPYWPGVVWGRVEPGRVYGESEVKDMRIRSQACMADSGES